MQLILVNGKKRSGKDYFAQMLKIELEKIGKTAEIMSFAGPIKEIIAETLDISLQELDDWKNEARSLGISHSKMDGHEFQKITDFRLILQKFGTEAMKKFFGEDVWVRLLAERAYHSSADFVIVPDFRFFTECDPAAITVKIKNANFDNSKDQHRSETELDNFTFMYTFDNTDYPDISKDVQEFARKLTT